MTLEEEVRAVARYMVGGDHYLANVPVPAFAGATWQQVFSGEVVVPENIQRAVLRNLRQRYRNFGNSRF